VHFLLSPELAPSFLPLAPLLLFVLTGSKIGACGVKNLAFLQNH